MSLSSAVWPQESHWPALDLSFQACKMRWLCKPQSAQQSHGGSVARHVRGPQVPHLQAHLLSAGPGQTWAKGWGAAAALATFRGLWSPFPRLGFEGRGGWREVLWGRERGWAGRAGRTVWESAVPWPVRHLHCACKDLPHQERWFVISIKHEQRTHSTRAHTHTR